MIVKAFYNSAVYKHDSELKDQSFSNIQSHIELAQIFSHVFLIRWKIKNLDQRLN